MELIIDERRADGTTRTVKRVEYDGVPANALGQVQVSRQDAQADEPGADWNGCTWAARTSNGSEPLVTIAHDGTVLAAKGGVNAFRPTGANDHQSNIYVDGIGPYHEERGEEIGEKWDGRMQSAIARARRVRDEAKRMDPLRAWSGWRWLIRLSDARTPLAVLHDDGRVTDHAGGPMADGAAGNKQSREQQQSLERLRDALSDKNAPKNAVHEAARQVVEAFGRGD